MCMTETDQNTRPNTSDGSYPQREKNIEVSSEDMLFTA